MKLWQICRNGRFLPVSPLLLTMLFANACTMRPMQACQPIHFHDADKTAIVRQIIHLEESIADDLENPGKTESYLNLALLHAHYQNPTPDYLRSQLLLEKYLSFDPPQRKNNEAMYLKALVHELAEGERERSLSKTDLMRLKKDTEALQEKNETLTKQNKNLQDAIEKLKALEMQLEEKRMNFK